MPIRSTDYKLSNAGSSITIQPMVDKIQSVEGLAGDFCLHPKIVAVMS